MNCDNENACSTEDNACGCGEADCGCGNGAQGCGPRDCGSGYAGLIFQAALEAKHGLLVEKIRARLEKTHGKKFDKAADLVAGVLAAKWKGKQEMAKAWREFEEGLEKLWAEK